jgi:hypothetical protein
MNLYKNINGFQDNKEERRNERFYDKKWFCSVQLLGGVNAEV